MYSIFVVTRDNEKVVMFLPELSPMLHSYSTNHDFPHSCRSNTRSED